MALKFNPATGKFEEENQGNLGALSSVQGSGGASSSSSFNPATGQTEASLPKKTILNTLGGIGKFGLNLGKEIALAPFRAGAAPLGMIEEGIRGFQGKDNTRDTALQRFAFGGTKGQEQTSTQRAFGAGERALDVATLGLGGSAAIQTGKQIGKQGIKQGIKGFATRSLAPKRLGIDAAVGAGFGVTSVGADGGSGKDMLKGAALGGLVGAALPPAFELGIRGTGAVTKQASKAFSGGLDTMITRGANKVERLGQKAASFDRTPASIRNLEKAKKRLSQLQSVKELPMTLKSGFLDSATPLSTPEGVIKELTGETVDLKNVLNRVPSRATGISKTKENSLKTILEETKLYQKNTWAKLQDYADALNKKDRIALGQEQAESADAVARKIAEIRLDSTPEEFAAIQKLQKDWNRILTQTLEEAVDAGRITAAQFANFRKAHPNYLPNVVEKFLENPSAFANSSGLQTTGFKAAKGSKDKLQDSFVSTIDYLRNQTLKNEQNKSAKELFQNFKKVDLEKLGIKQIETTGKDANIPKAIDLKLEGKDTFKYWENGKQLTFEVPRELGYALKNLDPQDINLIGKLNESTFGKVALVAPANFLRGVATQYNPFFAIWRNPARDWQNARITSDVAIKDLLWANLAGAADLIAPNSKMAQKYQRAMREASEAGGILGTGFFGRNPKASSIVAKATGNDTLTSKTLKVIPKTIEDIGGALEDNTRLAVFISALRKNPKDLDAAAKIAREATADFSKAGNWTREINKILPYLNARIRGFDALFSAVKKNPQETARKLMFNAAYPAVVLGRMNSQYESYDNIPTFEKRGYWILMTGEIDGMTADGQAVKIPQYIKLPKGEAQQVGSAIVDRIMEATPQENWPQFILDLATSVSPVALDQGITAIVPQGPKVLMELQGNKSFFTGKDIIPDYVPLPEGTLNPDGSIDKTADKETVPTRFKVNYGTSEVAKALGRVFNLSPAQIDHVVRNGVIRDIFDAIDIGLGSEKDAFTTPVSESKFFDLSTKPGIKTFIGTKSYGQALTDAELEVLLESEELEERILEGLQGEYVEEVGDGVSSGGQFDPATGLFTSTQTSTSATQTSPLPTGGLKFNPATGKFE